MSHFLRHILFIALLMLLAACASPHQPMRFYTLSAPATATSPHNRQTPLLIEVMAIRVPERLARPQIVVSSNNNAAQIRILEQDRWASHFNHELHDAFSRALTAQLGAVDINRGLRPDGTRSYRIAIELVQFDAVPDQHLQTRFSWSIKPADSEQALICQSAAEKPVSGGIAGMVQGMQQQVADVSEAISASIHALEAGEAATCGQPAA